MENKKRTELAELKEEDKGGGHVLGQLNTPLNVFT